MSKSLFKEFPEVSSKQWKQHIQFDLKGADYNETLIWKSNEGIDVKPFYHADELEVLPEISIPSPANCVITSYSIHYTKLYESRPVPKSP